MEIEVREQMPRPGGLVTRPDRQRRSGLLGLARYRNKGREKKGIAALAGLGLADGDQGDVLLEKLGESSGVGWHGMAWHAVMSQHDNSWQLGPVGPLMFTVIYYLFTDGRLVTKRFDGALRHSKHEEETRASVTSHGLAHSLTLSPTREDNL